MFTRRTFVRSLGGWALLSAYPAIAQQTQVRVAWLSVGRAADGSVFLEALQRGFQELGHIEGRNFSIELVVNLKTAKALGITIPPVVMVRAERVIQ